MSYKSGEIYFVREVDANGYSPFVKLGLVAEPRTSQQRLVEHQTGNPRKLELPNGHIVQTDLVSRVEAQLHSRFARYRIGGEWFSFENDEELTTVIQHAKDLARDARDLVPTLLEADRLQATKSNGQLLSSTSELEAIGRKLAEAKAKSKICDTEVERISGILSAAAEMGEAIPSVTKVFKPKFDQKALEADMPDLADKYLFQEKVWIPRFLIKLKLAGDFEPEAEFSAELSEIRNLIDGVKSPADFVQLSAPNLWLTKLKALLNWDLEILEAQLKIACGEFEGIEGICSWKREFSDRRAFDLETFMLENPDLYLDYLTDERSKTYPIRDRGAKR